MSNPSDPRSPKNGPMPAKERSQVWYEHMREVLAQNPANHGCTILMRNGGRTYRFHIPIAPIPKVEPDAKPAKAKRATKSKPRNRKEPIS